MLIDKLKYKEDIIEVLKKINSSTDELEDFLSNTKIDWENKNNKQKEVSDYFSRTIVVRYEYGELFVGWIG